MYYVVDNTKERRKPQMRITQRKQFSIDFLQSLNGKNRKLPKWISGVEYILTKKPEDIRSRIYSYKKTRNSCINSIRYE